MGYQRYVDRTNPNYNVDQQGMRQDHYANRSSARDYRAAGWRDDDDRRDFRDEQGYGGMYGYGYAYTYDQPGGYGPYGERSDRDQRRRYGNDDYESRSYGQGRRQQSDGTPSDYNYDDRGFFSRASDEVRSWFGDEEAERRRAADERMDEQRYRNDPDYYGWRKRQMAEFDRDYDDYRREKHQQFHQQFSSWRQERDTQRASLANVKEHMEVVGSDGGHVGTVDHVRGDTILLTKSDRDAHGQHHTIPVRWIETVDEQVRLNKTADEAQRMWTEQREDRSLFGWEGDRQNAQPRWAQGSVRQSSY